MNNIVWKEDPLGRNNNHHCFSFNEIRFSISTDFKHSFRLYSNIPSLSEISLHTDDLEHAKKVAIEKIIDKMEKMTNKIKGLVCDSL